MRAMVLHAPGTPLVLEDLPVPAPCPGQLRVKVRACAVCRTDLHVVDGELTEPVLPLVPGHEVVGLVDSLGPGVVGPPLGTRVLRSVANLTRHDGEEFLALAPRVPVRSQVHGYPLEQANRALDDLRAGRFEGAAVLMVDPAVAIG